MKGIILAGGAGTRLHPLTLVTSKQLLPVYNKPMIYYPLSALMSAGIRDILIISTPYDLPRFQNLLKDGSQFGIHLTYAPQPSPDGLAQAFLIGKEFIADDAVAMILGDNLYDGPELPRHFSEAARRAEKGCATIFGYHVRDPQRFGIVEFDGEGKVISIEEKPQQPKSNCCVTGFYFYDQHAARHAASLTYSRRGELEITDMHNIYLKQDRLYVQVLGSEYTWMDMGTHESLMEASLYVRNAEMQGHRKIGCPEEVAFSNGWIRRDQLSAICAQMGETPYSMYLMEILKSNPD